MLIAYINGKWYHLNYKCSGIVDYDGNKARCLECGAVTYKKEKKVK